MQLKYPPKSLQSGIGLIEVMMAVLILAIGLLGVASMQAMTLKGTQSSHERTVALIAAYSLGHVHPSGNLEPSAADRALTARLKCAVNLVDIRLLDHFVVGTTGYTSMAARGWV